MDLNVGKELATLNRMSVDALQARYAEVFGEPTNGRHKQWLVKRIIWRLQSLAETAQGVGSMEVAILIAQRRQPAERGF